MRCEGKMKLDKIFDRFTETTIFENKRVLQANYSPSEIPHRGKQIEQVASILAPCLRLEKPSNLFLYGKTGTGKTLVVNHVQEQLLHRAKKTELSLRIAYINCKLKKVADTEYRILAELIKLLGRDVPATGLPTDQLYKIFVEIVDAEKQLLILVLDEIDQAVKKVGDEFLYNLTRLDASLENSQIGIVGISNDLVFIDTIDPRVRSSLSEEEIVFPPYDALQLKDILRERAKGAFKKGVVSAGVIEKCGAYAAGEHGDARRALDLLRVAGELVERGGKKKVLLCHVDEAEEKIERDRIIDVVETQPKQFQVTLLAIIRKSKGAGDAFFTGDIYEKYEELCEEVGVKPLTQRRISDIIAEFDMLGIIRAPVISRGRHGKTREIKLAVSKSLLEKIEKLLVNVLE